jgi:hypothetical protein
MLTYMLSSRDYSESCAGMPQPESLLFQAVWIDIPGDVGSPVLGGRTASGPYPAPRYGVEVAWLGGSGCCVFPTGPNSRPNVRAAWLPLVGQPAVIGDVG